MGKKTLWVVLAIVAVLAILIWRVFANLDSIVAGVIEDSGSKALGTSVSVSGVSINLTEARAGISGLTIGNPDGFSRGNLFELDGIEVELNLESLSQDVIVIEDVQIGSTRVSYEILADGSNNVQALLDGIDSGSSEAAPEGDAGPPLKLIIDRLNFSGAEVSISSAMEGVEDQQLSLPGINMTGLGRPNGATTGAISKAVATELAGAVVEAAARAGVNKALEEEKEKLSDKLMDKLRGD
jgi:uncharacterized protein involved in outer membrane biogenesis